MRKGLSKLITLCLLMVPVISPAPAAHSAEFLQAIEPRPFSFPADHASHAGHQTEWWYVTGNAYTASGRRFGYQFTIFRRGLDPRTPAAFGRTSRWAASDFYLGHLAVSDLQANKFYFRDDLQRGAAGLAGATDAAEAKTPRVWLRDWVFERITDGWTLKADAEGVVLDLVLKESLAPVLHGAPGEEGLSRKGPKPGQASYYYSAVRLATTGSMTIDGQSHAIASGLSWMDHEFGSNQLSAEQAGWEWFAIHLDDGSSLMLYLLHNKDGSVEPRSSGTFVDAAGKSVHLPLASIRATPGRTWTSPHSGATYTLDWTVSVPSLNLELTVRAAQDDQEVHAKKGVGFSYYEGAIDIVGTRQGRAVKGVGYLEITGRDKSDSRGGLGGRL